MALTSEELSRVDDVFVSDQDDPVFRRLDEEFAQPDINSSLEIASKRNPDDHAENLRLAKSTDLPIDTVARNKEEINRREGLKHLDLAGYKKLEQYFADPDNASVSIDDTESLKEIEASVGEDEWWQGWVSDVGIDLFGGVMTLTEMAKGEASFWTGGYSEKAIEALGLGGQKEWAEYARTFYSREMAESKAEVEAAEGFFGKLGAYAQEPRAAVSDITTSLPMMAGISVAAKAYATSLLNKEGLVAGTEAANAFLRNPEVTKKIALAAAASEGLLVHGGTYEEAIAEGAPRLEAGLSSIAAGMSSAFISQQLTRWLPDVEATAGIEALIKGGKAKGLKESAKAIGKGFSKEGIEELSQESQEQIWLNIALGRPAFEGVPEAAASGLVAGAGTGGAISTVTEVSAAIKASDRQGAGVLRAVVEQEQIDRLIAGAQATKTRDRSPERFEAFMQSLGPDKMVYITQDAARELQDPPEYILEQINDQGVDIAVPLSRFVTDLAPDPEAMAAIRPHIRMSEGGLTASEIETGDIPSLKNLLEKAQKNVEVKAEADQIFESLIPQLVATGRMSESTARTSAAIIPAYLTTYVDRARKKGDDISISQVYEQFFQGQGLRIVGPGVKPKDVTDKPEETILDQIPASPYAQEQDFGDIVTEDRRPSLEDPGAMTTVRMNMQKQWDSTQKRRDQLTKMIECIQ